MIPNALSIFRILSVIPIVILFFLQFYILATALFLISSITDYFDGYIARRFNQESDFGSLLDLLADKILVTSLLIWFIFSSNSFLILLSSYLIILREIAVSSLRIHFLVLGNNLKEIKPNLFGKVKTSIQMIAIALILISHDFDQKYIMQASVFLFISSLISLASLHNYYSTWSSNNKL
jgi:CDP-diacylglycerol--glycerol-3-phosphate 3-phosphatidyltransferase